MYFDGMLVEPGESMTLPDETLSLLYTDEYCVEMSASLPVESALLPVNMLGKDSSHEEQAINQDGTEHRTTKGPPLSTV
jgi:hypothetical protein